MWSYEKKLQYPVNIKNPNPKLAQMIISQYGGPDGELGASMRYLSQRYAMPYAELKGILTDIGTEELGHLEMIGAIVHQLTRNLSREQIMNSGFAPYYVDHTTGIYPASGVPWTAAYMQSKGDPITDLHEDLAADEAYGYRQRGIVFHLCSRKSAISLYRIKIPLSRGNNESEKKTPIHFTTLTRSSEKGELYFACL